MLSAKNSRTANVDFSENRNYHYSQRNKVEKRVYWIEEKMRALASYNKHLKRKMGFFIENSAEKENQKKIISGLT